ncbi:hypothetical protein ACEPPN_013152 [Leptodophora sp. 'Broadleaf-Isolate-01']
MYCLAIIKVTLPGFGTQMLISVLASGEASLMLHVLTIFLVGRIRGHLTVAKGYLEAPKERFFTCRPIASSREVRLLRLLPRTAETEIRCELVHTSLDNSEPYEAISYTWESPERTSRIIVDNLPFLTTEKVYSLLRGLSLLSQTKLVWIDYVCINQIDPVERSSQVLLMREIYNRAQRVIGWLGEAPDAATAKEIVLELALIYRSQALDGSRGYERYSQDSRVPALQRFLRNDWFNRMWIIQEVAMARDLHMVYGSENIPWEELNAAIRFCTAPEMLDLLSCDMGPGAKGSILTSLANAGTLFEVRTTIASGTMGDFAKSVAFIFHEFKASDPRDKIYAILGVVDECNHEMLKPDYRKTVQDVYTLAAMYIYDISWSQYPLRILPYAGIGLERSLDGLPSWVPDWSSKLCIHGNVPETFTVYGTGLDFRVPYLQNSPLLNMPKRHEASLDTSPEFDIFPQHKTMRIRGFVVDDIAELSHVFEVPYFENMTSTAKKWDLGSGLVQFHAAIKRLVKKAKDPYPTGQSIEDVIWRTMIGDRVIVGSSILRPAPGEFRSHYRAWEKHYADYSSKALD